jgi:uncharacterized protein
LYHEFFSIAMKILAFTDVHANNDVHANKRALDELTKAAKNADLILCAGDISVFGMDMIEVLEIMNSWNKPVYFIHGNHEDEALFEDVNKEYANLHFVHATEKEFQNITVLGWGGGGFAKQDPELAAFAKNLKPKPNRIIIFHGPPHGTKADWMEGWDDYVGCKTKRAVVEQLQPFLVLCGHIHENFNAVDQIGKSIIMNPGPAGKLITIETNDKKSAPSKKPAARRAVKKKK